MSKLSQLMAVHMALLSATACHKNPFGIEYYRRKDDYGSVPTDKQKCRPKEQHEFIIKKYKYTNISFFKNPCCTIIFPPILLKNLWSKRNWL